MTKALFFSLSYLLLYLSITANTQDVLLGDFNRDGKEDFLAEINNNIDQIGETPLTLFLSEEQVLLFLEEAVEYESFPTFPELELIPSDHIFSVGDFNGDGRSDIIRQNNGSNADQETSYLLFSDGRGYFLEVPLPDDLKLSENGVTISIGDFNGDGRDDIFRQSTNEDPSTAVLLALDLDVQSNLFQVIEFSKNIQTGSQTHTYIGDFNGDGKADILIQKNDLFSVFLSNGDGSFQETDLPNGVISSVLVIGDFDGDGKDDIFGSRQSSSELLLSNGDGSFKNAIDINIVIDISDDTEVFVGDFNGDGKDDLYVRSFKAGDLTLTAETTLYFSNGQDFNQVSQDQKFVATEDSNQIFVGDFNGDGKADLLEYNYYLEDPLLIHFSNGDGTFSEETVDV